MRHRVLLLAGGSLTFVASLLDDPPAPPRQPGGRGDEGCAICHVGPTKALRQGPHAGLLDRADACTVCHTGAGEHRASALAVDGRPVVDPPPVPAASCAACHEGADLATHLADHRWSPHVGAPAPPAPPTLPAPAPLDPAERLALGEAGGAADWSLLLAAGYRFAEISGSRDRYDTDLNLGDGFRLHEVDLRVDLLEPPALLDRLELRGRDIGDPYTRVDLELGRAELYDTHSFYERSVYRYRATGDHHRVDRRSRSQGHVLDLELPGDLTLTLGFSRLTRESFWLTSRIGEQNVTPITTVAGVDSPRRHDSDVWEAMLHGESAGFGWRAGVDHLDERSLAGWSYDQASPVDPSFPISEDFVSESTIRGIGVHASLHRQLTGGGFDLTFHHLDRDRRVVGDGTKVGFDTADHTTVIDSFADGSARTTVADASLSAEVSDGIVVLGDLRWWDHTEQMAIDQTEITTIPSLGSTVVVRDRRTNRTTQRVLEGSVEVDVEPVRGLVVGAGYGFSREDLGLTDLDPTDADFTGGEVSTDGFIASLSWRPDEHWLLRARHEAFGQNNVQLHAIVEDRGRHTSGEVRWSDATWTVSLQGKDRQVDNDVARHRIDHRSVTAALSWAAGDDADLHASWTYGDLESRTLTSFYFDPDPDPVPTFVGFTGRTHVAVAGGRWRWARRWQVGADLAYTSTDGSFDVDTHDLGGTLRYRATDGGSAGVRVRHIGYDEARGLDDFDAVLVLVFWEQRLGG